MNRFICILSALFLIPFLGLGAQSSEFIPAVFEIINDAQEECLDGKEVFRISLPQPQPDWGFDLNELKQKKRSNKHYALAAFAAGLGATAGSTYLLVKTWDHFTSQDFIATTSLFMFSFCMNLVASKHLKESRQHGDEMALYEQSILDEFNRQYLTAQMQESLGRLIDFGYKSW